MAIVGMGFDREAGSCGQMPKRRMQLDYGAALSGRAQGSAARLHG